MKDQADTRDQRPRIRTGSRHNRRPHRKTAETKCDMTALDKRFVRHTPAATGVAATGLWELITVHKASVYSRRIWRNCLLTPSTFTMMLAKKKPMPQAARTIRDLGLKQTRHDAFPQTATAVNTILILPCGPPWQCPAQSPHSWKWLGSQ